MNETAFESAPVGGRNTVNSDQRFTRCWISGAAIFQSCHNSSWGHPGANKAPTADYSTALEWPIEANGQGAADLPREPCQEGWRRQRSPSHLCPLGCVLTTALDSGDPTQTRRREGRGGTRHGQGHFKPLTENRLMTLDKLDSFIDC